LSIEVSKIGRSVRIHAVDTVAQAEDGSLLVVSHSYRDVYRGHPPSDGRTRVLQFSPDMIRWWASYIRNEQERYPESAWKYTWYDGRLIVPFDSDHTTLRPASAANILTEESFSPLLQASTPLALIPLEYEPSGEGREEVFRRGLDDQGEEHVQQQAAELDRRRYDERVGRYGAYRVLYRHGELDCWLLLPESLWEHQQVRGGDTRRALLIGPAVIGDIVTYPILVAIVVVASLTWE